MITGWLTDYVKGTVSSKINPVQL